MRVLLKNDMKQHLLLDALHITMGGGKVLLEYLVASLLEKDILFTLIKDKRCGQLENEGRINNVVVMSPSIHARQSFYNAHKEDYTSVFCFANIPAPIKMPCPVFTYVHNVNLLAIPKEFPLKRKVMNWLKQRYIAILSKNTQCWIVQTQNTENSLRGSLPVGGKRVLQLPFFYIPSELKKQASNNETRNGYIIVGDYTGTRGHDELLEALNILKSRGFTPMVHMTVSADIPFAQTICDAVSNGISIVNHNILPFEELAKIYGHCKATVYPSVNESLGLGIIEAVEAGCDVVAPDLPFVHSICRPSEVFKGRTPEAIAEAVMRYEKGTSPKSELIVKDCIKELIETITDKE